MSNIFIGIDPDIERSGVAVVDRITRRVRYIAALQFPNLFDALAEWRDHDPVVVVEASWTTTKNWHLPTDCTLARAAAMGRSVGRNHATGELIVQMCEHLGYDVRAVAPLRKLWCGRDGKITHAEMARFVNGLPARTNQEQRDALLLAWVNTGLPIKI